MSEENKNVNHEEDQLGFDIEDVDFDDIEHNEKTEVRPEKKTEKILLRQKKAGISSDTGLFCLRIQFPSARR